MLAAVPIFSGCSAEIAYEPCTDENGDKYYTVYVSGIASSMKGELEIPAYFGEGENKAPVKAVADQGFSGTSLTRITLPATVSQIGTAAFAYNNYLSAVEFEEGITLGEISHGAFGNCPSLKSVEIPASVTAVSAMAFYGCTSLESVTFGSAESIGARAFQYCASLVSVALPDTLVSIGALAFANSGLTSVEIPDGVYEVGAAAFYTCTSLKSAKIGGGVTVLPSGIFGECTSLEEIYLPASLEKAEGAYASEGSFIYPHAFHNTALERIYYAGTREQWEAFLEKTDNTPVTQNGVTSDNGALFRAELKAEWTF